MEYGISANQTSYSTMGGVSRCGRTSRLPGPDIPRNIAAVVTGDSQKGTNPLLCLRGLECLDCSSFVFLRLDWSTAHNVAQIDTFRGSKLTLLCLCSQPYSPQLFQNRLDVDQMILTGFAKHNQVV